MIDATLGSAAWQADAAQLLEDHHLTVLSGSAAARRDFAEGLRDYLRGIADTEVITIDGRLTTDSASFLAELFRQMSDSSIAARRQPAVALQHHEAPVARLIGALRHWPGAPQRRYFIWREAEEMLDVDVHLFGRLVNALCAVAVEHEQIDSGPLVLQRAVFLGDAKLGAYTEDITGQFHRWLESERAFAEVYRLAPSPRVMTYRLDG